MAISGTTDRPLEMGARNSNAKIETYTSPHLDQAKTLSDGVVDYGGIEHSGEWSRKTVVPGCHNESMHETGLRSCMHHARHHLEITKSYHYHDPG